MSHRKENPDCEMVGGDFINRFDKCIPVLEYNRFTAIDSRLVKTPFFFEIIRNMILCIKSNKKEKKVVLCSNLFYAESQITD